ncbi:unnamed protein product, partial [Mesorhabditis spiculigera]
MSKADKVYPHYPDIPTTSISDVHPSLDGNPDEISIYEFFQKEKQLPGVEDTKKRQTLTRRALMEARRSYFEFMSRVECGFYVIGLLLLLFSIGLVGLAVHMCFYGPESR